MYFYLLDTKNVLFDRFYLVSFQMYYLLLLTQEFLVIFKVFAEGLMF